MGGTASTVYYDQTKNQLIDSANVSAVVVSTAYPKMYRYNEHAILRANIYSDASASTAANLSGLTMTVKIGTPGSAAILSANSASCNQVADWASVDLNTGKVCFWVNTASTALGTALGSLEFKNYACHLIGEDTSADDRTIAMFNVSVMNTPE